jgi:DnaJ-class molecular chaperone
LGNPCEGCQGNSSKNICRKCKGRGIIRENCEISVPIPYGIADGYEILLEGKGSQNGTKKNFGNLTLVILIRGQYYRDKK